MRPQLRVLSPCSENFDAMTGDGAARHCERCSTTVHALETEAELDALLDQARAAQRPKVCVRFRHDGAGRALLRATAIAAAAASVMACSGADGARPQVGPAVAQPAPLTVETDAGTEQYMLGEYMVPEDPKVKSHCRVGPDGKPIPEGK